METSQARLKSNFPFKTLFWVLFAVFAVLIFKPELKRLLDKTEELTLFGIEIKAGKQKAAELKSAITNYENDIAVLSSQITDQQSRIKSLNELRKQLEKDLANCPGASENSRLLNTQFREIISNNMELKTKSDQLKKVKIFEQNSTLKQ